MKAQVLRARANEMTAAAKQRFLLAYAKTGNITRAAKAAEVGRRTVYGWEETDSAFAAAMEEAREEAIDYLEEVAYERATKEGGSDHLLMFLLRGARPERYRVNDRTQLEQSGDVRIEVEYIDKPLPTVVYDHVRNGSRPALQAANGDADSR